MINIFKKKANGEKIVLKIKGMHCVSCSLNIDGELEDTPGVISATTSYAKGESQVIYDTEKISVGQIEKVISKLGYYLEE